MSKPTLLVIAGCNGAGKSSFSHALSTKGVIPFDYDLQYLKFYNRLIESEFQDKMAHNLAFQEFERQIEEAISTKTDFCYETNFNSDPMFWPNRFKAEGYELNLIFFCLDSIETAIKRVEIRVQNGGHFVPRNEIETRFHLGYKHLEQYFSDFSSVVIVDSSQYNSVPVPCLSVKEGKIEEVQSFPAHLKEKIPTISSLIQQ